jgi:hypothetical protein
MSEMPPLSTQWVDDGALALAADVVLDQLGVGGDSVFLVVNASRITIAASSLLSCRRWPSRGMV